MADIATYDVYTLELGPFETLSELHAVLSNHTATFATINCERSGQEVVSISHSILHIEGKFYVSAVTTTSSR